MFNELIVVNVTPFSGSTTTDKNGEPSVMLQCIAGVMPNRNVLSGTVAKRAGFEIGKTYLVQCREIGTDLVYGKQFNFLKLGEVNSLEVVSLQKQLGKANILIIERPAGFEDVYERKGDAVESSVTKRIKDGNFEPAIPRSTSHQTAKKVVEGSSITGANEEQLNLSPKDLEAVKPATKDDALNKK